MNLSREQVKNGEQRRFESPEEFDRKLFPTHVYNKHPHVRIISQNQFYTVKGEKPVLRRNKNVPSAVELHVRYGFCFFQNRQESQQGRLSVN